MVIFIGISRVIDKKHLKKACRAIEAIKPKFVLTDLIGDQRLTTEKQVDKLLKTADENTKVDPRFNVDVYRMAEVICRKGDVIGIDYDFLEKWDNLQSYRKDKRMFRKREINLMLNIREFVKHHKNEPIIIVLVNDDHIRSEGDTLTKEFGKSKILDRMDKLNIPFVVYRYADVRSKESSELVQLIKLLDTNEYL
jgi:hypothetical protein